MSIHPFEKMSAVVKSKTAAMKLAVEKAVIQTATAGSDAIIEATPVDTTKAVANWKVTHGSPFTGVVGERVPGSKKGSGARAAKSAMRAENVGRIKFFKNKVAMYIANNVRYIGLLEYGSSKRKPHGMVSKGLQAMRLRASTIRIFNTKP